MIDRNMNFIALLRKLGWFSIRVLRSFRANQGLLLSGAVAYYTLLSIIPLFAVLLVGLSHLLDEQQLLGTVGSNLELIVPGYADIIVEQISKFLQHRHVVGWIGLIVLLFFSSAAFTVLENAMSVIFYHRVKVTRRHFMVSAILPYLYILFVGIGLLLVSVISGALQAVGDTEITLLVWTWRIEDLSSMLLYLVGLLGLVFLLTSFYMVMPVGPISLRQALIGGITASIMWEAARHILIWYFSTISLVNLIYGSLATIVVALFSLEIAATIILLGAQVIAEYERLNPKGKFRRLVEKWETTSPTLK